jgi:site-specific DNA recombinase
MTRKGAITGGTPWNKAHIYRLLSNRKYIGKVTHHDMVYAGEHDAIVPRALWDRVHAILAENSRVRGNRTRAKTPALLKGLLRCGHCGGSMGATFTRSRGKTYRYYVCIAATKNGMETCPVRRVAAGEIETAVVNQLRAVFRTPEIVARTYREAKTTESEALEQLRRDRAMIEEELERLRKRVTHLAEANGDDDKGAIAVELRDTGNRIDGAEQRLAEVHEQIHGLEADPLTQEQASGALEKIDPVWDELFPREQARIIELLVDHVTVDTGGLEVRLRGAGLRTLVAEVEGRTEEAATA